MRWFAVVLVTAAVAFGSGELSNRRAPGFDLMDIHQTYHDPQDYRGKVLVVEIMQTTCPHCQKFSTILEESKKKYEGKLAVLYIVTAPDSLQMVQNYISKFNITSPVLFDSGQVIASYLKITPQNPTVRFPHVFLIDRNGMIRNDYEYGPATEKFFESNAINADIDKLLK